MFEAQLFVDSMAHHRAGRLELAESGYSQILETQPRHSDAMHLLGVVRHQRGDHAGAVELIEQAIVLRPNEPSFRSNLADAYRSLGNLDKALEACRESLRLQPFSLEAHLNLGKIHQSARNWREAESAFAQAVQLKPDDARAYFYLGEVQRESGRSQECIESYRRAIERNPRHAHAHCQLGTQLMLHGDASAAEPHLRRAVELNPQLAAAVGNLGTCLARLGRGQEAGNVFSHALRLSPNSPLLRASIGQALVEYGQVDSAREQFEQALKLDPRHVPARCGLADVAMHQNVMEAAANHFEKAIQIDPACDRAILGLASARLEAGDVDGAVAGLRAAIDHQEQNAELHALLGSILMSGGELEEAVAEHRKALQFNSQCMFALAGLATNLRGRLPDDDFRVLENALSRPKPDFDQATLHFGMAQVLDSRDKFDQAAEHLRLANALQKQYREARNKGYAPAEHHARIDALMRLYSRDFLARTADFGHPSDRPVFVFGLPRSGTTLVEQILASHPLVHGAGERRFAHQSLGRLPVEAGHHDISEITPDRVTNQAVLACAEWHLAELKRLDQGRSKRIVDKMPENYFNLGWLTLTLPKARLIHCRRDVRDVALSCWMTNFTYVRWANDLEHIGHRIREYQRIMDHWRHVLPVQMLEIDYEELVRDQLGQSRRLIEWIGLDWDPACLEFHKTKRLVKTASVAQVRQPIYSRSVGRWKHYEAALEPLLRILAADDAASPKAD